MLEAATSVLAAGAEVTTEASELAAAEVLVLVLQGLEVWCGFPDPVGNGKPDEAPVPVE